MQQSGDGSVGAAGLVRVRGRRAVQEPDVIDAGSTPMPVTCCMPHLFGSDFGQNGSTRYCGAPFLSTTCPATTCA